MYQSVTPIEIHLTENDLELTLDGRFIIQMDIQNKGTATLTLWNQTQLEQGDWYEAPANNLGLPFKGTIPLLWGSSGTKSAVVYALVGNF